jgi:hypothetical protein
MKPSGSVRAGIRLVGAHSWRKEGCVGAQLDQGQAGPDASWQPVAPKCAARGKPTTLPK